ncbi:unnamed protein product [Nesidiocoris tenuis]|uniref:Transmembrane 9 superfamily member n=1 Tax=Nesidiocoris tenuis TaxID=355587 RepID=A0A6H5HDW0_9HEMI|nr:unnamed protein product [Nesidiocoris tenuis]
MVVGDEHNHVYEQNDEVVLWMNTVGPYHNRQETYGYFSLPFCKGGKEVINHYHETLGEALQGVELDFSGLEIEFKEKNCHIYGSMPLFCPNMENYCFKLHCIRRQVFHLHFFLGVQNLLRVRLHAPGLSHLGRGYRVRNYRVHLFPPQRRRLQMAMDELSGCSLHLLLRVPLLPLLLLLQN